MAGGSFNDAESAQTEAVLQRFNQVFLNHKPDALAELVADDCVIENTQPAPDGERYEGTFRAGKRHGYGQVIGTDEKVQSGRWEDGKLVESAP